MAAHRGAAASRVPQIMPYFNIYEAALGKSLVTTLWLKYSLAELMAIGDSSAVNISPWLKSTLGSQRLLRSTD